MQMQTISVEQVKADPITEQQGWFNKENFNAVYVSSVRKI